jgi:type II secretory pathway pseudopilin PulG
MEPQLPDYLTQAQQGAETAAKDVASISSYAGSMPDALKKSIQQAYQDNQDVIGQLDTATAQYLQAPSEARVKFQDIWNPFQRENLVSQYTSNKAIPMMSWSGIYGQRMGRAGDLLSAGVGAYESDVAAKQAAAELAQQTYENALNQYQLEEDRRRWDIEQASKGAGETSLLEQLVNLFPNLFPNQQGSEDDFTPETPGQIASQYNTPVNTSPNLANTGNITTYTPPANNIYNAGGISSPFSGMDIDIGSEPQAPQQRTSLLDRIRGLF